ncbi:MAG: DUF456 domain-containing protein [Candidatus Neomarinimicrobiota bacterium]|jgi:hypothetical protein|nr:DUF456 domain-containing protein [Candidatus Neomarinimicrobiota bacterium]MDD3965607.1 DUF456 domain-containing protein [Candidatus Neomarinimicrobiota bacterium]MDX9779411.1 DUF456 domain-containing protein [bacterium]
MDYVLIVLGFILMIGGLAGCILPLIPGPPLSFAGLLILHATQHHQFSSEFLITWGLVTALVYGLDYVIPVFTTKQAGAGKRGVWGSMIGLILGLIFFPPLGIIFGPFIGAVIGELSSGKDSGAALKSGFASFVGFLLGTLVKLIVSGMMFWHFLKTIFAL